MGSFDIYSLLAKADSTYKSLPVNMRLLVKAVSQAIPEFGPRKLRRRGTGTEFFEARDFVPELDDPRKINARLTGKTGRKMVVEKEAEISQRVYLWRDPSDSMDFQSDAATVTKKNAAEIMMLAMARHLTKNEDVVGLVDRKGIYRGGKAAESIADNLYDVRIITGDFPSLRGRPPKNSTILLFSDFMTDTGALAKKLGAFQGRDLSGTLIMILDPQEIEFDYQGFVEFHGLKGEVQQAFKKAESIKSAYYKKLSDHIETIRDLAGRKGFNFVFQRSDKPLHEGLMAIYGMPAKDYVANPVRKLVQ